MQLSNETRIGMLVVFVAIGLFVLTWKAGDFDFSPEGYQLKVYFENIDGVETNAPVTLNGFEVGRVEDIRMVYGDETRVELLLWIAQSARIHEGAEAYVKNMGFLGEKYVGLTTGDDHRSFLEEGDVIQGVEPSSLEKLMAKAEGIVDNLQDISANVKERLELNSQNIDAIFANLRTSSNHLSSITANVDQRLQTNAQHIDNMAGNLAIASQNLQEMSADLKENPWKLLYKPKQ